MKPWMLAAISGTPQLVTKTFTSSQSFPIPLGVSRLESLAGKGQDGTPYTPGLAGYLVYKTVTVRDQNSNIVSGPTRTYEGYSQTTPGDYCNATYNSTTRQTTETCYSYEYFDNSQPATNGLDASGFGKTFPGGVAGPATQASYGVTPVTSGQAYSLTIPSGASITITYYQ